MCCCLQVKMELKLLRLWAVVQCLSAVNAAVRQSCLPPEILNGFSAVEEDTLYYACDPGFKPVGGDWWETIACRNGAWTSEPLCINERSCLDPEIANGNYTKLRFVEDGFEKQIRCNTGYGDKNQKYVALCKNGVWTEKPVCDRLDNWCEHPPQIPNGVLINPVQDIFPDDAEVEYACETGYELEPSDIKAICRASQWTSLPSCRKTQDAETTGNKYEPLYRPIADCPSPPSVQHAQHDTDESGMSLTYQCDWLYKLKGNSIVRCLAGHWTPTPTCEVNHCKLETTKYNYLENTEVQYLVSETYKNLRCVNMRLTYAHARALCTENQLFLSQCCNEEKHNLNKCPFFPQSN